MPLPTIPKHLLTGEFKDFIDWAINNRKLDQCISVDMDVDVKEDSFTSGDEELNKISYVKHLPSYNFILGTGLYDNDIRKELKSIKED